MKRFIVSILTILFAFQVAGQVIDYEKIAIANTIVNNPKAAFVQGGNNDLFVANVALGNFGFINTFCSDNNNFIALSKLDSNLDAAYSNTLGYYVEGNGSAIREDMKMIYAKDGNLYFTLRLFQNDYLYTPFVSKTISNDQIAVFKCNTGGQLLNVALVELSGEGQLIEDYFVELNNNQISICLNTYENPFNNQVNFKAIIGGDSIIINKLGFAILNLNYSLDLLGYNMIFESPNGKIDNILKVNNSYFLFGTNFSPNPIVGSDTIAESAINGSNLIIKLDDNLKLVNHYSFYLSTNQYRGVFSSSCIKGNKIYTSFTATAYSYNHLTIDTFNIPFTNGSQSPVGIWPPVYYNRTGSVIIQIDSNLNFQKIYAQRSHMANYEVDFAVDSKKQLLLVELINKSIPGSINFGNGDSISFSQVHYSFLDSSFNELYTHQNNCSFPHEILKDGGSKFYSLGQTANFNYEFNNIIGYANGNSLYVLRLGEDPPLAPTSLSNTNSNLFKIYPNPSRGLVFVDPNDIHIEAIKLVDVKGRVTKLELLNNFQLDISAFTPGQYVLIINSKEGVFQKKITKL